MGALQLKSSLGRRRLHYSSMTWVPRMMEYVPSGLEHLRLHRWEPFPSPVLPLALRPWVRPLGVTNIFTKRVKPKVGWGMESRRDTDKCVCCQHPPLVQQGTWSQDKSRSGIRSIYLGWESECNKNKLKVDLRSELSRRDRSWWDKGRELESS